jgi:hypothetical protein
MQLYAGVAAGYISVGARCWMGVLRIGYDVAIAVASIERCLL